MARPAGRGGTRDVVSPVVHEPPQPEGLAPVKIAERTDGIVIVFDGRLSFGRRTAWTFPRGTKATDEKVVRKAWEIRGKT